MKWFGLLDYWINARNSKTYRSDWFQSMAEHPLARLLCQKVIPIRSTSIDVKYLSDVVIMTTSIEIEFNNLMYITHRFRIWFLCFFIWIWPNISNFKSSQHELFFKIYCRIICLPHGINPLADMYNSQVDVFP